MTYLITGATGFVGQHVMKRLPKGAKAIILATAHKKLAPQKNVTVVRGDLTKPNTLRSLAKKLPRGTILLHLASAVPKTSDQDKKTMMQKINVAGTKHLLEAVGDKLSKVVIVSTVEVYGHPKRALIDEATIPNPTTFYGKSKLEQENLCTTWGKKYNVPVTILRLSVLYGPRDTISRAIPNFISQALTHNPITVYGGQEKRDYLHVSDAARAILLAAKGSAFGVFCIGTGAGTRIIDAAKIIRTRINPGLLLRILPPKKKSVNLVYDITKAKKALGFVPKLTFPDGLDEYIEEAKGKTSHIILDLDGTLVDIRQRYWQLYGYIIKKTGGRPLSRRIFWNLKRNATRNQDIFAKSRVPQKNIPNAIKLWVAHIEQSQFLAYDKLFPGVTPTLQALSGSYTLHIVTMRQSKSLLLKELRRLGIASLFATVTASPFKGTYIPGRKREIVPSHLLKTPSLQVGDSEDDIASATHHGFQAVAVTCGIRSKKFLAKLKPNVIISDITHLPKLLKSHGAL